MPKLLIFLILIVTGFSLLFNLIFIKRNISENVVVEVVDGDTFQLKSGIRVRLMGVDAPEIERCGGNEARQRLSELILNKNVELKEPVQEAYGRTMALVYQNNQLVNLKMMADGWGRPDYRKNSQRESLTSAYHDAQNKKLGLYGFCIDPKQSTECNIKGNIDMATFEKFYHLPSCRHWAQTSLNTAYGDAWFCSEAEAIKAGFIKSTSCSQ